MIEPLPGLTRLQEQLRAEQAAKEARAQDIERRLAKMHRDAAIRLESYLRKAS